MNIMIAVLVCVSDPHVKPVVREMVQVDENRQ